MTIESRGGEYYHCRIPGIIFTTKGSLIACYECRKSDSDWSEIDIKVIRSTDNGSTWNTVLLKKGNGNTLNNPVLTANGDMLHLVFCINYSQIFHMISNDDGITWSKPVEITKAVSDVQHTVVATGPGHGIVTKNNVIVIPVWFALNKSDKNSHHPSFIGTLCSNDNGRTWFSGQTIDEDYLDDPSESACALLADGSVLMSVRNENKNRCRFFTKSRNGYEKWEHIGFDSRFSDPVCQGSMTNANGAILHINCNDTDERRNLTLIKTADDFATIKSFMVASCGGYSDLCVSGSTAYIIYEDTIDNDNEYYVTLKFSKMVIN